MVTSARPPRHALPLTVKGVVVRRDKVLLTKDGNTEWTLPGGPSDAVESADSVLTTLIYQLTGQQVAVGPEVSDAVAGVEGDRSQVTTYGCVLRSRTPLQLASESHQLAWLPIEDLPVGLDADELTAITVWRDHPDRF